MTLKQHYTELYKQFGSDPRAIQWSSKQTQFKRFEILCSQVETDDKILDLGCGLGDMATYLRDNKNHTGNYFGLDFVPDFISSATNRFSTDPKINFKEFDIHKDTLPNDYDVIILSGVFNNIMDDNWAFIVDSLQKMYAATNRTVSFNALSTYVDYEDDNLYYTDPLRLFDYCKKFITPTLSLQHDYLIKENSIPFEFTMHLKK